MIVNEIRDMTDSENIFMMSFDFNDLYTNVSLKETINICLENLYDSSDTVMGMPPHFLGNLLE